MWSLLWHLKLRFIRKHHIICTGLPKWEWYDTDTRMLYGMMGLFMQYLEDEKPFEVNDWDDTEDHRQIKQDILIIRDWWANYDRQCEAVVQALTDWHDERFKGCADGVKTSIERINTPETYDAKILKECHDRLEKQLEDDETEMLCQLVKIRKYLWT